jgi:hypothetical protein
VGRPTGDATEAGGHARRSVTELASASEAPFAAPAHLPALEGGRSQPAYGRLLCAAYLPGASDALATHSLIGMTFIT